ncbi:MAG: poly-beta-1,6-N-acetyl-D-glucosamine biosynthesis protein PgaD [Gammaproteobacteria bacterium]|nr:poly-beta-1,6-N-acetyl-D-glucosamine biosynthesis protein PgaD [Gammaproteobacteria bacterium]MCF6363987.1 poly-beta-1,6-N-acetyl-D-glucosamine biosynthesis protein PgaD [Gammaproteobacteria bacterium]
MNNSSLIIENPHCQGKVRRLVQGAVTLMLWLLWFYLLLPVFEPVLTLAGIDLSVIGVAARHVNFEILVLGPLLVGVVVLGFWLWVRYNILLHRFRADRQNSCNTVGRSELADSFGICPLALTDWHSSDQLLIRLTEQGGIRSVEAGELKTCHFSEGQPANEPLLQTEMLVVSKAS